jgi:hypothetical protein
VHPDVDILRDPLWQSVGVFIALLTLVVAYRVLPSQLRRKSLSYSVRIDTLIYYTSEDIKHQIKVLFLDKEIRNLTALHIEIENDGFVEIKATDFDKPLTVVVDPPDLILSATVSGRSPEDLPVRIDTNMENEVQIQPLLLNRGDWLRLTLLINDQGEVGRPKISARIQGVTKIRHKPTQTPQVVRSFYAYRFVFFAMIIALSVALAGWMYRAGRNFALDRTVEQLKESQKQLDESLKQLEKSLKPDGAQK